MPISGLSLCIQGTSKKSLVFVNYSRFIPVHTGNIHRYRYIHIPASVYPCAYRKHITITTKINVRSGLSLCIQGTCSVIVLPNRERRFIPVHTGNMSVTIFSHVVSLVYPCAYREHATLINPNRVQSGLSLCIQGTF